MTDSPQAIPFAGDDSHYLARIDLCNNEIRETVKKLKLLIAENEGEQSAAFLWAQDHHAFWKAVCSLTCKAIRGKGVRNV